MKPGGANAKGGAFERLICRKLTEWITGKPKPEIFWRSATSGAKATVEHKAGRDSHMGGDLVTIHPKGQPFIDQFSVELKHRKSYGKMESLIEGKGALLEWWNQCEEDAIRSSRYPLLIFKANRTPIYVAHVVPWRRRGLKFSDLESHHEVCIVTLDCWLETPWPKMLKMVQTPSL